jgi:ssDNA-binding Zn-finger/Zn-ribbon topoisomerase 1
MPERIKQQEVLEYARCPTCGKKWPVFQWNSTTRIALCDDMRCDNYRHPIHILSLKPHRLDELIEDGTEEKTDAGGI